MMSRMQQVRCCCCYVLCYVLCVVVVGTTALKLIVFLSIWRFNLLNWPARSALQSADEISSAFVSQSGSARSGSLLERQTRPLRDAFGQAC